MATHLEGEIQKEKFSLEYGITSHRDVLAPPHVIQRTWVVAAEVIRGEGIQPLDLSALVGFGGVDPYVQLQFGNQARSAVHCAPMSRSERGALFGRRRCDRRTCLARASPCGSSSSRCAEISS